MAVYEVHGVRPTLGRDVYVAETAAVVGDVHLGDAASVWFGAVVRGDCYPVRIGARTNVQDNAVVHVTAGIASTTVGDDVTIAHAAVVHGCTIGNRCLVGIGAIVLDGAVIGDDTLIAAGSLVVPGAVVPPRSVVMGRPGRVVRTVTEDDLARIHYGSPAYVHYAAGFIAGCRRIA